MDQPSINNQPSFCWWGTRTGWICIVSVCAFLILSLSVADARAAFSTSPGPRTASRKEGSSAHGPGEGPWLSSQETCAHLISSYISCLFSSLISFHLILSNQYFVSSNLILSHRTSVLFNFLQFFLHLPCQIWDDPWPAQWVFWSAFHWPEKYQLGNKQWHGYMSLA